MTPGRPASEPEDNAAALETKTGSEEAAGHTADTSSNIQQEPLLTLYDLFGFSAEERSQITPKRHNKSVKKNVPHQPASPRPQLVSPAPAPAPMPSAEQTPEPGICSRPRRCCVCRTGLGQQSSDKWLLPSHDVLDAGEAGPIATRDCQPHYGAVADTATGLRATVAAAERALPGAQIPSVHLRPFAALPRRVASLPTRTTGSVTFGR